MAYRNPCSAGSRAFNPGFETEVCRVECCEVPPAEHLLDEHPSTLGADRAQSYELRDHIILHAGGIVDDRLLRPLTGASPRSIEPQLRLGEEVQFTVEEVSEAAAARECRNFCV